MKRGDRRVRGDISLAEALDDAAELVPGETLGWAGLLALTLLPLRFLEALLAERSLELGKTAFDYTGHLLGLSALVSLALIPALWGRAVYCHACSLALSGRTSARGVPFRLGRRLPAPALVSYFYAASVAELLLVALAGTWIAFPVVVLFSGLAAATAPFHERPGPIASLRVPLRHARSLPVLLGLTAILGFALLIAWMNLFALFWLGLSAADAAGIHAPWWQGALSLGNRFFVLLVLAGAATIVEPFWLAALVSAVIQARSRQSGEDLAAWFEEIRGADGEEAA